MKSRNKNCITNTKPKLRHIMMCSILGEFVALSLSLSDSSFLLGLDVCALTLLMAELADWPGNISSVFKLADLFFV